MPLEQIRDLYNNNRTAFIAAIAVGFVLWQTLLSGVSITPETQAVQVLPLIFASALESGSIAIIIIAALGLLALASPKFFISLMIIVVGVVFAIPALLTGDFQLLLIIGGFVLFSIFAFGGKSK